MLCDVVLWVFIWPSTWRVLCDQFLSSQSVIPGPSRANDSETQTCPVINSDLLWPLSLLALPDVSYSITKPSAHTVLHCRWTCVSSIHKNGASVCANANVLLQGKPLLPLMINQKDKLQVWITELLSLPMPNTNQMSQSTNMFPPFLSLSHSSQTEKQSEAH